MPKQPPNLNWPHVFDEEYVFKRLGVQVEPESRKIIRIIAQEIYEVVAHVALKEGKSLANMFKSSNCRNQIQIEWRTRLHRLPALVRTHTPDDKLLAYILYRYIQATAEERRRVMEGEEVPESEPPTHVVLRQREAQLESQSENQEQGQEQGQQPAQQEYPQQPQQQKQVFQPKKPKFLYGRPYVVPNGDIQIIRVEQPGVPIVIRISDLLADKADPENICPNGDWINIANIQFDEFKRNLIAEGYFIDGEGESMWLNPNSLDTLNPLLIFTPQEGEIRLSSLNMASTLLRIIREHWPKLRNPSPDPWGVKTHSPLIRPNLTILIRSAVTAGGALTPRQPAIARPAEKLGSNVRAPTRRAEQMARYRATRRETMKRDARKRKRGKQGEQSTAEGAMQTEAEVDSDEDYTPPESQERQKRQKQYEAAVPTVEEGHQAVEINSDDGFNQLLDPRLFNESGMLMEGAAGGDGGDGDDERNIFEAFFAQNSLMGADSMGELGGDPLGEFEGDPLGDLGGDPLGDLGGDQLGELGGDPFAEILGYPMDDPMEED